MKKYSALHGAAIALFQLLCFWHLACQTAESLLLRQKDSAHNFSSFDGAIRWYQSDQGQGDSETKNTPQIPTFESFYNSHSAGRGIWKWSNSLKAYQRHFAPMAGHVQALAEVGVQSGGSILMWQHVLGPQCHVYGIDINPACRQFANAKTTIAIGDQGNQKMWNTFYQYVPNVDIFVDDGSHLPHHMGLTLHNAFPHIKPGGYVAMEDIHGTHYVESFFIPAAQSIHWWSAQNLVASVHVYPFELFVHKSGGTSGAELLPATPNAIVDSFAALWSSLPSHRGGTVAIDNPLWGSFLSKQSLSNIFREFANLHDYNFNATPPGCEKTSSAVCTVHITNSPSQSIVSGVHIFPTRLVVESAATPPNIHATRRGNVFLSYSGF